VASPHKRAAPALADARSPAAERVVSANLLFRRGATWTADTTDPAGVLALLGRRRVAGKSAAVVGCGGSGRAIALAMVQAGARVTLVNRSPARGQWAAHLLGLPWTRLSEFSASGFDLIVNATPVGRQDGAMPFAVDRLDCAATVVDLVYDAAPTPLVAAARDRGATVLDGRDVLLVQVARQFARMTGRALPAGLAAGVLGLVPAGDAHGPRPRPAAGRRSAEQSPVAVSGSDSLESLVGA
jgi:3-dehydroquinate dehydratase/shikimate dehydrogenase